ncbi:MAG: cytochrome B5 [Actinobacteria bacterium]|nr:cytochrome B5 [Actinomycetota bacterium]
MQEWENMTKKDFNIEELKEYNGKNGKQALVAYEGVVYDVTGSFLWHQGRHQVSHYAGEDLTGELERAPHGLEFLKRFPVAGRLKQD